MVRGDDVPRQPMRPTQKKGAGAEERVAKRIRHRSRTSTSRASADANSIRQTGQLRATLSMGKSAPLGAAGVIESSSDAGGAERFSRSSSSVSGVFSARKSTVPAVRILALNAESCKSCVSRSCFRLRAQAGKPIGLSFTPAWRLLSFWGKRRNSHGD